MEKNYDTKRTGSLQSKRINIFQKQTIQGDFESCAEILTTSYWLHAELGKNTYLKKFCQKIK
jgi:hypothetical protein